MKEIKQLKELDNYYKACNQLVESFLRDLFADDEEYEVDYDWIGGACGEVFAFSDYFLNMDQVADYYEYGYDPDLFWSWYDDYIEKEDNINMKNYRYLKGFRKVKSTNP